MPSFKRVLLPAALTLALIAPFVGASAAHPHTHIYVGTAANTVVVHAETDNLHSNLYLDSAVVGFCADGSPILKTFFPPEPARDGDNDVGVGGGCFAFQTVYGDDTGATLHVNVQETISSSLRPVWVTCVDRNGDGTCEGTLGEPYNVCTNGLQGAYSLVDNGPCTVYADPAATLNPAVFVLVIGGLNADGTVAPSAATAGTIFVY